MESIKHNPRIIGAISGTIGGGISSTTNIKSRATCLEIQMTSSKTIHKGLGANDTVDGMNIL